MKVRDRGPRFAAAVQHNPASSKVSSDSSGNKHTYAPEVEQPGRRAAKTMELRHPSIRKPRFNHIGVSHAASTLAEVERVCNHTALHHPPSSVCVGIRQSVCVRGKRLNKREERDQQTANTRERESERDKKGGGERDGDGGRERGGDRVS
ncbi:unnamed protein product, partial [Pleuronectes platessa]